MNAHNEVMQGIQWALDNRTSYRIANDLDLTARASARYKSGESDVKNMSLDMAGKLYNYAVQEKRKEADELNKIEEIIKGIESFELELSTEYDFDERQFQDGANETYISYRVKNEDLSFIAYFGEKDFVKEKADEVYNGVCEVDELDDLVNSLDIEDQFNFNKVVGYRVPGKMVWL